MNNCYLKLPAEQQTNPYEVLHCFNQVFPLSQAKQQLADCIEVALSTDNMQYDSPKDRADLFRFYHLLEDLVEACAIINEKAI